MKTKSGGPGLVQQEMSHPPGPDGLVYAAGASATVPCEVEVPTERPGDDHRTRPAALSMRVLPEVGLRLTRRKATLLRTLFELARDYWNLLAEEVSRDWESYFGEDGRLPTPRALAGRFAATASLQLPPKAADGVRLRMASAIVGGYRALREGTRRLRWTMEHAEERLGERCEQLKEVAAELSSAPSGKDRKALLAEQKRLAKAIGKQREKIANWQEQLQNLARPDVFGERLPKRRPNKAEAESRWQQFLMDIRDSTCNQPEDLCQANRDSMRYAFYDWDPPPVLIVRGRDCPCVLSPSGTPVLLVPAPYDVNVDGYTGSTVTVDRLHPAWAAAGITRGRRRHVIPIPLTLAGWKQDPFTEAEVAQVTLIMRRCGPHDTRIYAQIGLRSKPVAPIVPAGVMAAYIGLYPRLTVFRAGFDNFDAVEVLGLLDEARQHMTAATIRLGPQQHGTLVHVTHGKLIHEITTAIVQEAVASRSAVVVNEVGRTRHKLVKRFRWAKRFRWHASSWNHAELVRQLDYKLRAAGLPETREYYVRNDECPSCGLGSEERRRTRAQRRAWKAANRVKGEYHCESCGHSEGFEESRARVLLRMWERSHRVVR